MTRIFMHTYSRRSKGAKVIREGVGLKTFLHSDPDRTSVTLRPSDLVINWGSASFWSDNCDIWNKPSAINIIGNKRLFMEKAAQATTFKTPTFTTNRNVASEWPISVARTILRGTRGEGIVITNRGEDPPLADLYTRYIKKAQEWRVHVAFGRVIDFARKIRDPNREVQDWQVRSLRNGFIFARESGEPNEKTRAAAIAALDHFGLDFGGVDIITTRKGNPYVLEINSAPALIGTTQERYIDAFNQQISRR